MTVIAARAPVDIVIRRPIEKEKSQFQSVTTTVFPNARVSVSLSSISVPEKQTPVTTDYIIIRVDIVGPKTIFFVLYVR